MGPPTRKKTSQPYILYRAAAQFWGTNRSNSTVIGFVPSTGLQSLRSHDSHCPCLTLTIPYTVFKYYKTGCLVGWMHCRVSLAVGHRCSYPIFLISASLKNTTPNVLRRLYRTRGPIHLGDHGLPCIPGTS